MEMKCVLLNTLEAEQNNQEYREISEFGITPNPKEADYLLTGSSGILVFINAGVLGFSHILKNMNQVTEKDYWVGIAIIEVSPKVEAIVHEQPVVQLSLIHI